MANLSLNDSAYRGSRWPTLRGATGSLRAPRLLTGLSHLRKAPSARMVGFVSFAALPHTTAPTEPLVRDYRTGLYHYDDLWDGYGLAA